MARNVQKNVPLTAEAHQELVHARLLLAITGKDLSLGQTVQYLLQLARPHLAELRETVTITYDYDKHEVVSTPKKNARN